MELGKITANSKKISKYISLSIITITKIIFWFIFCCLLLLQTIIFLNIINDMPNEIEYTKTAIVLYTTWAICFIVSLLIRKRALIYIFAFALILLFAYLSSVSDLSPYFGYFDGLD